VNRILKRHRVALADLTLADFTLTGLALVHCVLVFALALGAAARTSAQDAPVRYRIPVTHREPSRGPEDALVTIVVFNDFECPFCSRVTTTIDQLVAAYPRDVRVVFRNNPLPFHAHASLAAQAAMEAFAQGGNSAFWQMHTRLYANQRALDRADLERYAAGLRLNLPRFRRALDAGTHLPAINTDQAIAALFGVDGTPGFMINGRQLMGAQPFDAFDTIVRDELRRANELVQRGTPRARVYTEITSSGLTRGAVAPTGAPTARRAPDPTAVYSVPIASSPVRGPADALVTIVEFTDLQCPFCARVQPALEELARSYGADVRFVLKHNPLPFHDRAMPIARLLVWAAPQGKAFALHDQIFANQRALTDDDLVGYALAAGLDGVGARAALSDTHHDATINADMDLARSLGATGTPSFFINGRNLRGAQPFEAFRTMIDEELASARARVASGTARRAIYDAIVRSGLHEQRTIEGPAADALPDADRVYTIAVPADAPTRGAARGRVVVQQFSDFQCPFCSRVEPTIDALIARYGDRVTFVWRDYPLPFHDNAFPTAEAAREIRAQLGVPAFWRFHAMLFAKQRALTRPDLERYARELGGVDMRRFRAALTAHTHEAAIRADMSAVAQSGAQIGTPSFFVNGRLLQGALPLDVFVTAIDRALGEPPRAARTGEAVAPFAAQLIGAIPAPPDVAVAPRSAQRTASGLASRFITRGRGTRAD